jgi:hypothetical protein
MAKRTRCAHRTVWRNERFRWQCVDCGAERPMVNAHDLAKLMREWKRNRHSSDEKALDALIVLLTDAEALSTVSISGWR